MRGLEPSDLKDKNIFKYYRLIRKWACKTYGLNDADLELLIYLDCCDKFDKNDFIKGVFTYSWDKKRWDRLLKNDWIKVWRTWSIKENRRNNIYTTSHKTKVMINRIYKIILGEEEIPTGPRSKFYKNKSYTDKCYNRAIDDMLKDSER